MIARRGEPMDAELFEAATAEVVSRVPSFEAQRLAARAERLAAVGLLAAGLAHEVRNPLNSAALLLQLLERRLERGDLDVAVFTDSVRALRAEIHRLDRLV